MADELQVVRGGLAPMFDLRGREAWTGGGAWPIGDYEFELQGHAQDDSGDKVSMIAVMKCLKAPEGAEAKVGEMFREYFTLDDKAGNFWLGFLQAMLPKGEGYLEDKAKCYNYPDGRVVPRLNWVDGGKDAGARGAIFSAHLEEQSYTIPKGKKGAGEKRTIVRMNRGSVKLLTPSSYYTAKKGQTGAGSNGGGTAPAAGGLGEDPAE